MDTFATSNAFMFIIFKIQYGYQINPCQIEIPSAFFGLRLNRKSSVIDSSIYKMRHICSLHLDDERFTMDVFTQNVKNGLALLFMFGQLFGFLKCQRPNLVLLWEY